MKRRLDLAAALIHNPDILFLDEPTTGLDPVSRAVVWEEVRRLNDELGMTVFLTTQYLEEADALAGRVGIIDHGRIVAEGTPADLKRAIGSDMIVARVDGDARSACAAVEHLDGVLGVEAHGNEIDGVDRRRSGDDQRGCGRPQPVRRADPRPHPAHAHARRRLPRAHGHAHRQRNHQEGGCVMTAVTTAPRVLRPQPPKIEPRPAGFVADVVAVAGRALRAVPRDLESVMPPVFIALFFFLVNVGTLQKLTEHNIANFDFRAFQMPTAILLGVTGVSRAPALVIDVQNGYFDRLLLTPVRRLAILLGHLVADVTVAAVLTVPIIIVGFLLGVRFEAGPLGIVVFIAIAALWSLAFSGFGYAIALKTGNPGAVNSTFLLFFPFLFLTTSYVPKSQLTGWLKVVASWNPVTYLLEGLRSLVSAGWNAGDLAAGVARGRNRRRAQHDALFRGAPRAHTPGLIDWPSSAASERGRRGLLDIGVLDEVFDDGSSTGLFARSVASACWVTSTRAACQVLQWPDTSAQSERAET